MLLGGVILASPLPPVMRYSLIGCGGMLAPQAQATRPSCGDNAVTVCEYPFDERERQRAAIGITDAHTHTHNAGPLVPDAEIILIDHPGRAPSDKRKHACTIGRCIPLCARALACGECPAHVVSASLVVISFRLPPPPPPHSRVPATGCGAPGTLALAAAL